MKFTVIWVADSQSDLAAIWVDAADRQSITEAAERIDGQLESRPMEIGESRGELFDRWLFESPLFAAYLVDEARREVYVYRVGKMR